MICRSNAPQRRHGYKKVSAVTGNAHRRVGQLAVVAVAAFCATIAFRRLDDFDTWWHLAAGRWIVVHGALPATDTLSHTVRDHPWINLQWGFDLALYALHALGGPALLSAAAAAGFTIACLLTLRLARTHLGDVSSAVLLMLAVVAAQDRFAVRPEMLSFPLLACVLSVLDHGRRRDGRGLWGLVPLMLVWVNVHALFVVGAFAILCAMLGSMTPPSRKLLRWGGLSLAAALVNPFGLAGALFPLKLVSRIDGSNPAFQTIAEFRSPFSTGAAGVALDAYKVLLVIGCVLAVAALAVRGRTTPGLSPRDPSRFDFGGLLFFAGLLALSLAARRNVALFALGGAPFIASCAGTAVEALPRKLRDTLRARAPVAAVVVACGAVLLGAWTVTGGFYRWDRQPREFGAGVIDGIFPVRAAAAMREAGLPSTLYNDVAAGGYLTWADPLGTGVFIDGRLEVYDTAFFSDYVVAMYDPARFEAAVSRYGIQTAIVFHHWENRRLLVDRLFHGGVWSLVYADEVAAVFVRVNGNETVLARAASMNERWNQATRAWLERPVPRWYYPAGRVEATRAFARLLATFDDAEGAVEIYGKLLELGVAPEEEIDIRLRLARRFAETGRVERAREEARRVLALAPSNLEARKLLE